MQVIYAAPFILLSLIAFAACLAVARFRPYAFRALVVPVAFGFCSIVALAIIVVTADRLHLLLADSPLAGSRGVFVAIPLYFVPGVVGAWLAIEVVRRTEIRFLRTQGARALATRIVIALIAFGPAFIVCTGVQFSLFPRAEEWLPLCLALSLVAAGLVATLAFVAARALQKRLDAD
jgi:hypothetical protein